MINVSYGDETIIIECVFFFRSKTKGFRSIDISFRCQCCDGQLEFFGKIIAPSRVDIKLKSFRITPRYFRIKVHRKHSARVLRYQRRGDKGPSSLSSSEWRLALRLIHACLIFACSLKKPRSRPLRTNHIRRGCRKIALRNFRADTIRRAWDLIAREFAGGSFGDETALSIFFVQGVSSGRCI